MESLTLYLNFLLLLFVWRAAVLLYRNEPVTVFGINLTSASFDSGSESAPYILTLADNAGSPDPSQVDYNNGSNQWYKEGTWTISDGSGAGLTLTTLGTPTYVKVGNLVFVKGRVEYPTTSDTSNARIGTLPFTVENNSAVAGGGIAFSDGKPTHINAQSNSALLGFENSDGTQTTNADLSGSQFSFSIVYNF